ncbi:MAG: hypothetical protein Q7T97_15990 [Burkholderiaceae bacterium]|nr:hypothetical protein [Burkholderiaceae bacterium]
MSRLVLSALIAVAATLLVGCEQLGIESPEKIAAAKQAEGSAVGGACRHAGRAIEDCYELNKKADKAAVFAGWREMNDYMRDNKIEPVPPQQTTEVASAKMPDGESVDTEARSAKPAKDGKQSKEPKDSKEPKAH